MAVQVEKTERFAVKRRLGLVSCVSFIVGNIVGSGIFISPKGVYAGSGSVALCLVLWACCGIIAVVASFVYAELSLIVSQSGGDYTYLRRALGNFPAFMYIWSQSLVIHPMSHLIKSMTVAEYFVALVLDGGCGQSELVKRLTAALIIVTFTMMNLITVRLAAGTQVVMTTIKVLGLLVIIVGGAIHMAKGNYGHLVDGFHGTTNEINGVASAMYSGIFAYGGWNTINFSIEEVSRPRRTVPVAILTSVFIVMTLYLLVNVSYFAVLNREEFLSSWAVGFTWSEKILGKGAILIPLVVCSSVFGSAHGASFESARLGYAAARDETFPELFSYINVYSQIPSASVLFTSGLALVYLALPGDVGKIINYTGFVGSGFNCLTFLSHIILSIKTRKEKRPIKVPVIISVLLILVFLYLFIAPFIGGTIMDYIFPLSFLGAGVLAYFPFVFFKLRIRCIDFVTVIVQLILNVAPPTVTQEDGHLS